MTNEQAKLLFYLEKETELKQYTLPSKNEALSINLNAKDEHHKGERFTLDINRKSLSLKKRTFQSRVHETLILRRLDFFGGHQNPPLSVMSDSIDDTIKDLMKKYAEVRFHNQTHIHFYIEDYGEKWAFPIGEFTLTECKHIQEQAKEFCQYCNIELPTFYPKDLIWT